MPSCFFAWRERKVREQLGPISGFADNIRSKKIRQWCFKAMNAGS